MLNLRLKSCVPNAVLVSLLLLPVAQAQENPSKRVILEVISSSWNIERNETLVYLRVFSDGSAEAHPMREIDFRNVQFKKKQLSSDGLLALRDLLIDPATDQLMAEYSRNWGNVDFGHQWDITISVATQKSIRVVNFQPFLARKERKPYPKQVEKLGCSIWKTRAEVTGEALEKNWPKGCAELGY